MRYRELGLEGKKYHASVNGDGFQVLGEMSSWRIPWGKVSDKNESKLIFLFRSHGALFIFAKRYLTDEQQRSLRSISGLAPT